MLLVALLSRVLVSAVLRSTEACQFGPAAKTPKKPAAESLEPWGFRIARQPRRSARCEAGVDVFFETRTKPRQNVDARPLCLTKQAAYIEFLFV